ncbi:hypothetical protein V6N12_024392 [Hibiscus sabdariffa]|uniref:Uncharacterized protein n=1 Tax=Hibiscus sabdariffa TaxID=183260 RepID=A0ABR2G0E6_9ROSI
MHERSKRKTALVETVAGRMVAERQRGPVRVAEKRRAAAGTRFRDEEETRMAVATQNCSGQPQMLIFTGRRG